MGRLIMERLKSPNELESEIAQPLARRLLGLMPPDYTKYTPSTRIEKAAALATAYLSAHRSYDDGNDERAQAVLEYGLQIGSALEDSWLIESDKQWIDNG